MSTKDTNSIKLTPLLQLQPKSSSKRSSTLFSRPSKTHDIIEKFRKDKSQAKKKRSLFSAKNDVSGLLPSNKMVNRCKSIGMSRFHSNSVNLVHDFDPAASAILESYFEAVKPVENTDKTFKHDGIFVVSSTSREKPQHSINDGRMSCPKSKTRFSAMAAPKTHLGIKESIQRGSFNLRSKVENPYVFSFYKADEIESIIVSEREFLTPSSSKNRSQKQLSSLFEDRKFREITSATTNKQTQNQLSQKNPIEKNKNLVNPTPKPSSNANLRLSIHLSKSNSSTTNFTSRIRGLINKK